MNQEGKYSKLQDLQEFPFINQEGKSSKYSHAARPHRGGSRREGSVFRLNGPPA